MNKLINIQISLPLSNLEKNLNILSKTLLKVYNKYKHKDKIYRPRLKEISDQKMFRTFHNQY